MKAFQSWKYMLAGGIAGAANGFFGAGGGMLLVPLLGFTDLDEDEIFPTSVCMILPICVISLSYSATKGALPFHEALPYLLGSIPGGIIALVADKRIKTLWLHRILGVLILFGAGRYLL